ncbi:MAG: hypothetical protein LBJ08_05810, partial [Bifidobacteriaceae bacterium]|nr:hypothetical protein [Bifidobacteriaceae bacterium]
MKIWHKPIAICAAAGLAAGMVSLAGSAAWADPAPVDSGAQETELAGVVPVDPDATPETVALFQ